MRERGRFLFSRRRAETRKREKNENKHKNKNVFQVLDAGVNRVLKSGPSARSGKLLGKGAGFDTNGLRFQVLDAGTRALFYNLCFFVFLFAPARCSAAF